MARKFKELRQAMSPEAQARAHEKALAMKAELSLADGRQDREEERHACVQPTSLQRGDGR